MVWKLDRLSRSLKDVPHIMERAAETGAGFRSSIETIDDAMPAGRMTMQMVGSFAELERAMGRECASAGPAIAWAKGFVGRSRVFVASGQATGACGPGLIPTVPPWAGVAVVAPAPGEMALAEPGHAFVGDV